MKKLFTPLLMLAALLSSTQAWAEAYDLWVGGVQVTDANASNITSAAITGGKVRYVPSSKNLIIGDGTVINYSGDCINSSIDGLSILFSGSATITTTTGTAAYSGLYLKGATSLSSYKNEKAPVVKISATNGGRAIITNSRLSVYGNRITATAANEIAVFGTASSATFNIYFSQITAKGGSGKAGIQGFSGGISLYGSALDANQSISSGTVMQNGSAVQTASIYCSATIGSFNVPITYAGTLSTSDTGASSASGTAQYNSSTKTLTLTNVNVDGADLDTHGDMTINFVGGGTISSSGYTMDLYGNTTLNSDGKVIIKSTGHTSVYLNYDNTNLEICMPEFQATCTTDKDGVYGSSNCKLILKKYNDNSVYKFLGGRSNVSVPQIVLDDMDIWSSHTWIKEGKVYYNDAIASSSNGPSDGTWFKSKNQFTYYPLYVAGTQVNHRNNADIRNQYITSGTVSYNTSTKTLTLDGVTMNVTADDVSTIKTTSGAGDITIQAVGDNTLTSVDDAAKLYSNTTFTSSSIAYLRFISNNSMGVSMYGSANATVDMVGFFQAKGAEYGFYGDGSTYPNAVLTLKKASSDEMGYNFTGAEGAIRNLGSLKLDNMDFWYSTYGCYFDEADKRVEVNGGAVAKGQVVFGSIKETLPISVCGKQLNRVNGADNPIYVGSKYISSGTQSVGYVPSTKTLTLNNAKIENSIQKGIALESGFDGYIKLVGTNSITTAAEGYYSCIATMNDNVKATFQGDGSLYAKGGANCALMPFRGTMIITDNVKIDAVGGVSNSGTSFGGIGSNGSGTNGETVIISGNAQVKANRISRIATLTLEDGQTIVEPFKAAFNSSTHQVEANGSLAQDVVIQKVEKYDLAVCDIDVNSYNKDDILRDGGSFKYDPNMKRLTITDADIDDASVVEGIYNKGIEGLNIAINGDNQINVYEDIFKLARSTTFSGSGTVKSELTSSSGYGIFLAAANVIGNLNGPKFEFTGRRGVGDNDYSNTNLIIEKGCLVFNPNSSSANILKIKNLTLGAGMIIAEPQGGAFSSSLKGITVDGTNLYYGHAVICQKGDVNLDGTVTIADAVAVLNAMAGQEVAGNPDVNGDKEVSIADFVAVLNIMAGQ